MLDDLLGWLPWIGGASTLTLIVVALLAPSVLTVASNWLSALSPLLKGLAEGLAEVAKSLWAGFLDMTDNGKSILFVGAVALGTYLWGYTHGVRSYEPPARVECPDRRTPPGVPPVPSKKPSERSWMDEVFGSP